MWQFECSLSDLLSMLESRFYSHRLNQKYKRRVRRINKANRNARKSLQEDRTPKGWGERKREVESAVDEIRRLREY